MKQDGAADDRAHVAGASLEIVLTGLDSWLLTWHRRWTYSVPLTHVVTAQARPPLEVGSKRHVNVPGSGLVPVADPERIAGEIQQALRSYRRRAALWPGPRVRVSVRDRWMQLLTAGAVTLGGFSSAELAAVALQADAMPPGPGQGPVLRDVTPPADRRATAAAGTEALACLERDGFVRPWPPAVPGRPATRACRVSRLGAVTAGRTQAGDAGG